MRSGKKVLAVCSAAVTIGCAVAALAQEASQPGPLIRTQVSLVNLFVTVRDKSKRIVTDLKQADFKVSEAGQPQQIAFCTRDVTLLVTLAMLLDCAGSEQYMLGAIQGAGGRFIDRVVGKGD